MADLTVMKQRIPSIQQVPNEDVLGERGERVEDPPRNCCSLSNLHSISMQQGDIVIPIVTDEETLALRDEGGTPSQGQSRDLKPALWLQDPCSISLH